MKAVYPKHPKATTPAKEGDVKNYIPLL